MKTVKKLIIERISSVDQSDGSASPGGSKKSTANKQKSAGGGNSNNSFTTPSDVQLMPDTGGGGVVDVLGVIGEPMAPYAVADPSPSPSICAETPSAELQPMTGGSRSPSSAITGYNSGSPISNSPFNFTPTTNMPAGGAIGVSNSLSAPAIKPQKSRRKISLPWFRQTSVVNSGLTRQYTIDSPGSFRLFRQSSNIFKVCVDI